MKNYFAIFTILLLSGATALGYTNMLENTDSQTITNGWDAAGDMIVGDATSSNTLIIASGGSLTNINAFVGKQAGVTNNTATVSGASAEWINTGTLQVGASGNSNNTVSVSSGGTIFANNLTLASNNTFNLNNGGALDLASGFDVSTNGFNWNAGGTLSVGGVLTGLETTNEGSILSGEKTMVLNGGSLTTSTNLIVGYESSNNTLAITNGATAANADGYIGWGVNSANNAVLVSGAGSAWTNSGNLHVGVYGTNLLTAGSGNSLTVTNDAWVFVGGLDTHLTALGSGGVAVASNANMVVGASASVLADGLYINTNGNFNLDGTLTVNNAFDADQAGFHWNDGATLTVHDDLTLSADLDGTNQALNIDGGSWNRGGDDLRIDGEGNAVSILNGGAVTNVNGFVVGSNNSVVVSGKDSHWLNNGALNLSDSGNHITVDSGGKVTVASLNIAAGNDFNLNSGGMLAMTDAFGFSVQTNLNWNYGGNLSVGGVFSGLTNLTGGRVLTLDGSDAKWNLANTNIAVSGASLVATNGATVTAENLRVDGGGSTVKIASDAGLLVGDGATSGAMVASTNGAELVVGGSNSRVDVDQTLFIGVDADSTGTVSVANGGTLSVGGLVIKTNSVFTLDGRLEIGSGFDYEQDGDLIWNTGGTLAVGGGALTGLDALGGTNRTLEITAGGSWGTSADDLLITGMNNTLVITEGGQVTNQTAFIGVSSNDVDNTVRVDGDGSEWNLSGSLFINPGNTLALASTGLVTVAGNMVVSNATVDGSGRVELGGTTSRLSIYGTNSYLSAEVLFDGKGGAAAFTDSELVVDGSLSNRFVNFGRLSLTNSLLGGEGMVDGFANINMTGGRIAPDIDLVIAGDFDATNTTLQVIAGAGHLRIMDVGGLALSNLLADVTITNTTVTSAFTNEILAADHGLSGGFAETNFNERFLLYDFELIDDGTNVSVVADAAADGEISASLTYAGIQGIRAGFNGMQNAAFVRTQQLRRNSVATDHAISNEIRLILESAAPDGPQGPGDQNTIFGMHFWAEQFSGQGDYDTMGNSNGFTLNNNGTSFGLDKLVGDSLVVGITYAYARSAVSMAGGDRSDTETYWLGLYGEWFSKNEYYLEGLLALGWSDYDTLRTDVGYRGEGSFRGNDFGGHIEGGKYFHTQHWALAPYAGLNYLGIKSDAYTETDQSGGLPIDVDGQSVASFESALGVKLRNRFDTQAGRFQTVGYAEWAYDFINDDIGSSLSDGSITVGTARIAPGASVFNAGVGVSWICTDYLEVGLGYDGRFNENYEEHTGSIMLDVRF